MGPRDCVLYQFPPIGCYKKILSHRKPGKKAVSSEGQSRLNRMRPASSAWQN